MGRYQLTIGEKNYEIEVLSLKGEQARVLVNGRPYEVHYQNLTPGAPPAPAPPVVIMPSPSADEIRQVIEAN